MVKRNADVLADVGSSSVKETKKKQRVVDDDVRAPIEKGKRPPRKTALIAITAAAVNTAADAILEVPVVEDPVDAPVVVVQPVVAPIASRTRSQMVQTTCDIRMDPENDVLVLRTPQVGTLHKVFNAMKELMTDLMIVVDRDLGTVSIDGFDSIRGYYVRTALRFEQHICRQPQLMFSVPASSFHTMLAKATTKHTVYLFVPQSSFVKGHVDYVHFQFETPGAHEDAPTRVFTISLPTLNDFDKEKLNMPPIAYPMRITLGSQQFRKDMSDLAEFAGDNLRIVIEGEDCFFSSALQTGATLGGRIHYPKICAAAAMGEEGSDAGGGEGGFAFEGLFPLKIIKRIIKCSTLSSDVVLAFNDNKVPMNFYYPIGADFGDMNVYLAAVNRAYGVA